MYAQILKKAYHVTKSHPVLWLFGLLFAASINTSLLTFVNFNPFTVESPLFQILRDYQYLNIFVVIALFFFWLAINFARVIFILFTSDLLNIERRRQVPKSETPNFKMLFKESKNYFVSVSLVNLLNFLACLAAFFIASRYLETFTRGDSIVKIVVPVVGYVILAFTFNLVDIFASFFIVLYRSKSFVALNLTLDLLIKKSKVMLKGVFIFVLLYVVSIILVSTVWYFAALLFSPTLINNLITDSSLNDSLIVGLGSLIVWLCMGVFNIFFKTCFLLFFAEVVKPPLDTSVKESQVDLTALPAGS